jgi:hypothetical protein
MFIVELVIGLLVGCILLTFLIQRLELRAFVAFSVAVAMAIVIATLPLAVEGQAALIVGIAMGMLVSFTPLPHT